MITTLKATPNDTAHGATTAAARAAVSAAGPDAAPEGPRFDWARVAPEAMRARALFTLEQYVRGTGLDGPTRREDGD